MQAPASSLPHRDFIPAIQVPVDWLAAGKLPPVCLFTGVPTDGHLKETVFDVAGAGETVGPASPGARGLYCRRMTVLLPVNARAHRAARWRLGFLVVLVAGAPVATLCACREYLGWRTGSIAAAGVVFLVIGFLVALYVLRNDVRVTEEKEGWAVLTVPSPVAGEAIRSALAAQGLSPPSHDGAPDGNTGTPRTKPSRWIVLPKVLLFVAIVLPVVLTWRVVRRMGNGVAAFLAGVAVLGGIAAVFVSSGPGIRGLAGPTVAFALTGGAWVMAARPGDDAAKRAVACALCLDIVALLHVLTRILVEF